MANGKPVSILWSKAACIEAGAGLAALQDRILAESAGITAEARDWFVHAVPSAAEEDCFVCTGRELPEGWLVYVQSGLFRAAALPEVLQTRDNDAFAPFDEIGRRRPLLSAVFKIIRLMTRRQPSG